MSPDDRFADTVFKSGEYHSWGVHYCWIVDPENKQCWQYDADGHPGEILSNGHIEAGPIILNHAHVFESL